MNSRSAMESLLAGLFAALALSPAGCGPKQGESPFLCESTASIGGYVRCEGEWMHRPEALECPSVLPRPTMCTDLVESACQQDADCAEKPNGVCSSGFDGESCYCEYGCRVDADCEAGNICVCGDPVGQCRPATCTVDADCEEGLCASVDLSPYCYDVNFVCQSGEDQCVSSLDCPDAKECSIVEGQAFRSCVDPSCSIGRPFLVAGEVRVAPAVRRGDWLVGVDVAGVEGAEREALAEHWTRAGVMEHASIAAFARFVMQLLAMGAPARLVAEAQAAICDELEHARVCFGLASAYAGRDVGPGALDVLGALGGDFADFVVTAIHEGCVGETVAALEASEAARHAEDPRVRAALEKIAADEGRHAELAWRFVQWAIEGDGGLRAAAEEAFAAALGDVVEAEDVEGAAAREDLLRHGVLGPGARGSLRRAALAQVVGPCARTLLAACSSERATNTTYAAALAM